jgi:hypothetical protein
VENWCIVLGRPFGPRPRGLGQVGNQLTASAQERAYQARS